MVRHSLGKTKRPRDPNQLAKLITDLATGEKSEPVLTGNPKFVERASKAGKVGGKARAEKLTPEERKKIAAKAAKKRWG